MRLLLIMRVHEHPMRQQVPINTSLDSVDRPLLTLVFVFFERSLNTYLNQAVQVLQARIASVETQVTALQQVNSKHQTLSRASLILCDVFLSLAARRMCFLAMQEAGLPAKAEVQSLVQESTCPRIDFFPQRRHLVLLLLLLARM